MQAQMASLVENNSYGLNGGSMAGAMDSTNFHMHGGHVTPTGFGDNVVGRYTTGQDWTTIINIPEDHGRGSYWYHPQPNPNRSEHIACENDQRSGRPNPARMLVMSVITKHI